MQAENEALQQLVLDVAQNKQEAQRKVAGLKQKYGSLLAKVQHTFSATSLLLLTLLLLLLCRSCIGCYRCGCCCCYCCCCRCNFLISSLKSTASASA